MHTAEVFDLEESDRPLTHSAFNGWRANEFLPHVRTEELNESRIIKMETHFVLWNRIFGIILTTVVSVGGYVWQDTMRQMHLLQEVAITNQKAIERIGATQSGVLEALKDQRETDKLQMALLLKMVDKGIK